MEEHFTAARLLHLYQVLQPHYAAQSGPWDLYRIYLLFLSGVVDQIPARPPDISLFSLT